MAYASQTAFRASSDLRDGRFETQHTPQAQVSHETYEGMGMGNARAKIGRTVQYTDGSKTTERVSTAELVDFVREKALRLSIKELCKLTGLSEQAVKNLRLGTAGASAQTISTWCRNDPQFRTEYFQWCGGYIETDPEFVAGITMALNSLARRGV